MSHPLEVSVGSKLAFSAPPREEIKQKSVENGLIEYVNALKAIDENNKLAKLNAVSISDNNGGRIFF